MPLRNRAVWIASLAAALAGGSAQADLSGSEFQVNTTSDEAKKPAVAMAGDGRFVAAWEDKTAKDVFARRYDASGSALGGEFQVSTSSDEHKDPAVAMADDGSFVVVWENDDAKDIFARRYDSSGSALGSAFQVSTSSDEHKKAAVAMEDGGGFVVVWENDDAKDIFARRYDASGSALGSAFQVSTSSDEHKEPAVAMADDGSFVVVWENDDAKDIFARRYNASGSALGSAFQVSTSSDEHKKPAVAIADDGSFVVVWENDDDKDIFARRYNASGSALGSPFQVSTSSDEHKKPAVAVADDGSFVVVWENDDDKDVFAREYDTSGNPVGGEYKVNTSGGENKEPAIAMAGNGDHVVVWEYEGGKDVLGQRYGGQLLFTDVSAAMGVDSQSSNSYHSGSGWHWGDLDNDGDLDAIVTGNSSSRLWINNNAGQSFSVSTFGGGSRARQGALLDIDNDGDLDFWHCDEKLYENNGSASFTDRGNLGFSNPSNGEGVAAVDVNHDGRCDVLMFSENGNWIGHASAGSPAVLTGTNSSTYGLNDSGDKGNGDFCSSGDVNNDGYLDFFYNYGSGKLFLSDGDGTYTQNNQGISVVTGNNDKMGSAWADYDNDGDLDLFVPRYDSGYTGTLWRNDGGSFTNVASSVGITDASGQRSCCWGDYDNDGDLDLYLVAHSGNANVLYQNQGSPNWNFQSVSVGAAASGDGHDAVFVDYDNDGDLDLAISQEDAGNTLLRNNTNDTNYLKVRVIGGGACGTNKAAIGIRVDLYDAAGTTFLARREIGLARGFAGAEPMWVHFGGLSNTTTYTVKVHLDSGLYSTTVVPASVSTTIGSTTIQQMLTVEETAAMCAFTDVTAAAGLSSVDNSYGACWGDYDNDGWQDLYVTDEDKLFHNNGDSTFSVGPSISNPSSNDRAAHFGDYDNDGDLDLGVTRNLYINRNNGDGTFSYLSNSSLGISSINDLGDFAWIDFDKDGDLDLWAPNGSSPYAYMYSNDGDGTFTAIDADTIGLSANTNGEATVVADYDGDGYIDILYRASSVYLWHNNGDGTFTNATSSAGISLSGTSGGYNGTAFGDYDNDGDLDLYGGQGSANKLYRNNGDGTFTDVTSAAGVAGPSSTTKGVAWGDYDNDGDLDLYVANESAANNLFENNGDGTFTDVADASGVADSSSSYGLTWEDYDNDGDLDLFVGNSSSNSKLYRNNANSPAYLKVRVIGRGAGGTNAAGIGARVELYDAAGTTYLAQRTVGVASSFGSNEPLWVHFGGVTAASTYTVKVHLDTGVQTVTVVPANTSTTIGSTTISQMLTVTEPASPGVKVINWREVPNTP